MNGFNKEHLLHKVLAGSAFAFALALLPIASHYFQQPAKEQGNVAGVSTERPLADIAAVPKPTSAAECAANKQAQLDDLDRLQASWQSAYAREMGANATQAAVDEYTAKYEKEFAAVETERQRIEAQSCS